MIMGKRILLDSHRHRASALGLAALVGLTTLTTSIPEARADEVSPTGKGISGGALLGAEVVTIPMGIAGVHSGWAYLVGGVLGAGGGAVGGYFVEQSSLNGQGPVYMLAGGLALVIPALVLSLNATRYRPSEGATEDHPPAEMPSADPGNARGSVVAPSSAAPRPHRRRPPQQHRRRPRPSWTSVRWAASRSETTVSAWAYRSRKSARCTRSASRRPSGCRSGPRCVCP